MAWHCLPNTAVNSDALAQYVKSLREVPFYPAKCDLLLHVSKMRKGLLTADYMYSITVWYINYTDRLSEQCLVDSLRQLLCSPQCCLLRISADAFYGMNRTVRELWYCHFKSLKSTFLSYGSSLMMSCNALSR